MFKLALSDVASIYDMIIHYIFAQLILPKMHAYIVNRNEW